MFSGPLETIGAKRTRLRRIDLSRCCPLLLIPTLYVMLEERSPRRVPATEGAPVLQGDMA